MKNLIYQITGVTGFLAVAFLLVSLSAKADEKYEEISYEDLVSRIGNKTRPLDKPASTALDQVRIHTGVGYVNSFSQVQLEDKTKQRYQNGMQLSLGVDLFSRNWLGETCFRNFGITTYGSEEIRLREFDLKMGYVDAIKNPVDFRIMGGMTTRYLQVQDSSRGINIDENSPGVMISGGLLMHINPTVSLGFDVAGRSALIGQTADRSSIDFTFDIRATL